MTKSTDQAVSAFFANFPASRPIYDALDATIDQLGPVERRAGKSQVAVRRRVAFAWAWIPDRYLRGGHAPLVLSIALRRRDVSPRWKEIVEPSPGRFIHHLELYTPADIDDDVKRWLDEAYAAAG